MSTVYLATHTTLKRSVALKLLTSDPFGTGHARDFEERFRIEAETLAGLDHPNIVTIYDYGETDDGQFYLVMEHIDGPRCTELLRHGGLSPRRALNLVMQVGSALSYAHDKGMVHRDIKPSNILLHKDSDRVKVVDFGLVQLQDADAALSHMGFILGSPHFMAPEQAEGLEVDSRADIYAVGVLLFTALTGRYPFHGPDAASTLAAHIRDPIPPLRAARPDLQAPAILDQVVAGCLAKLPEQRYQSMHHVLTDLARALGALVRAPEPSAPTPVPADIGDTTTMQHSVPASATPKLAPPPSRSRWLAPAVGVTLGVLVLLGMWGIKASIGSDSASAATVEVAAPAPEVPAEIAAEAAVEDLDAADEGDAEAEDAEDVEDAEDAEDAEDDETEASAEPARPKQRTQPAARTKPPPSRTPAPESGTTGGTPGGESLPEVRDPWAD